MGRSTNSGQDGQDPRGGRPQPYAHHDDLQRAGEPVTGRAENPLADGLFNSGMGFHSTPDGGKRLWAMIGLGNGEFTPMTIAAICAGVTAFFVFGGCVLGFRDHPGWMFATFALSLVPLGLAGALAFYESITRRRSAAALYLRNTPKVNAHIVLPSPHAELDVRTETTLPPQRVDNPSALDGGEPVG